MNTEEQQELNRLKQSKVLLGSELFKLGLHNAIKALYGIEILPQVKWNLDYDKYDWDYTSPVALQIAKQLKKSAMDVANEISKWMLENPEDYSKHYAFK